MSILKLWAEPNQHFFRTQGGIPKPATTLGLGMGTYTPQPKAFEAQDFVTALDCGLNPSSFNPSVAQTWMSQARHCRGILTATGDLW